MGYDPGNEEPIVMSDAWGDVMPERVLRKLEELEEQVDSRFAEIDTHLDKLNDDLTAEFTFIRGRIEENGKQSAYILGVLGKDPPGGAAGKAPGTSFTEKLQPWHVLVALSLIIGGPTTVLPTVEKILDVYLGDAVAAPSPKRAADTGTNDDAAFVDFDDEELDRALPIDTEVLP